VREKKGREKRKSQPTEGESGRSTIKAPRENKRGYCQGAGWAVLKRSSTRKKEDLPKDEKRKQQTPKLRRQPEITTRREDAKWKTGTNGKTGGKPLGKGRHDHGLVRPRKAV